MSQKDAQTDAARANDDSVLIDEAGESGQPRQSGRSGGSLAEDVATQAELERVRDPEAEQKVTKDDDIAHGHANKAPGRRDV